MEFTENIQINMEVNMGYYLQATYKVIQIYTANEQLGNKMLCIILTIGTN